MALTVTLELWRCAQCGLVYWLDPSVMPTKFSESYHTHLGENTGVGLQWSKIGSYLFKLL